MKIEPRSHKAVLSFVFILHQVDFWTFWLRLLHLNFVENARRNLGYACAFRLVQAQNTLPKKSKNQPDEV